MKDSTTEIETLLARFIKLKTVYAHAHDINTKCNTDFSCSESEDKLYDAMIETAWDICNHKTISPASMIAKTIIAKELIEENSDDIIHNILKNLVENVNYYFQDDANRLETKLKHTKAEG